MDLRAISHRMDLNTVIAELREELETVKEVTAALEKLIELRLPTSDGRLTLQVTPKGKRKALQD